MANKVGKTGASLVELKARIDAGKFELHDSDSLADWYEMKVEGVGTATIAHYRKKFKGFYVKHKDMYGVQGELRFDSMEKAVKYQKEQLKKQLKK